MKKPLIVKLFNLSCLALSLFLLAASCRNLEARKPIEQRTSQRIDASIVRNKKLVEKENKIITNFLKKQPVQYQRSENSFWYTYIIKDSLGIITPQFGERVTFLYDIRTLTGDTIYPRAEKTYIMEQEELFIGLREGLKLMKVGEQIEFVFPSYTAFGYYGDEDRIKSGQIIRSNVTLINIEPNNQNKN